MKKQWEEAKVQSISLDQTFNSTAPEGNPDGAFGDLFADGIGRFGDCQIICS